MAKEKNSKKQNFEKLRILDALIRQADSFLGSDTEIPRKVVTLWHAKARVIIASVAGRNSNEAKEFNEIQLEPPVVADRYFKNNSVNPLVLYPNSIATIHNQVVFSDPRIASSSVMEFSVIGLKR